MYVRLLDELMGPAGKQLGSSSSAQQSIQKAAQALHGERTCYGCQRIGRPEVLRHHNHWAMHAMYLSSRLAISLGATELGHYRGSRIHPAVMPLTIEFYNTSCCFLERGGETARLTHDRGLNGYWLPPASALE